MSRRRSRAGNPDPAGGLAVVIGVLLIVAVVIIMKFLWWILGAVAIIGVFYIVRAMVRAGGRERREPVARYNAEIAGRADQQHEWVMRGDDRGFYGPECAPLMHYVEYGGTRAVPTSKPSDSGQWSGGPPFHWRRGPFGTRFK